MLLDTAQFVRFPGVFTFSYAVSHAAAAIAARFGLSDGHGGKRLFLCAMRAFCIIFAPCRIFLHRTWIQGGLSMERHNPETIGVRRTGWAALDRDPQQDTVEFLCPHCGNRDQKNARRERTLYRFTDGFMQDLQGEVTQCHSCKQYLRVVPIVLLHDQDETRRFAAVFADESLAAAR
jgi:hypothetical protein